MPKTNPFENSIYIRPKNYCKQENNFNRLLEALTENQFINVNAEYGIGKATSVKTLFYYLEKENKAKTFFINIDKTESIDDFFILFVNSIIKQLNEEHIEKIKNQFAEKITPENSIQFSNKQTSLEEATFYFEEILKYIQTDFKNVIFAIDEFDQAKNYPENNSLLSIKSAIASFIEIKVIFISSANLSKTLKIKSLLIVKPDEERYKNFIKKKFKKNKIKIETKGLDKIFLLSKGKPYYVQLISSRLFEQNKKEINEEIVTETFAKIVNENESSFFIIKKLLTPYQIKLLRAIAKQGIAKQVTSASFIFKNNLNAPSSVKTALNSLLEKELIVREKNSYQISNMILNFWLAD
ncbi:MAG: hypothetical protein KDC52_04355 [Ignavibacteriae bacterium]|nr:hypothetical protein [Ignavibacteriota bacterium]